MGKTQCAVVVHGTVLFTTTLYGYLSCVQLAGGGGGSLKQHVCCCWYTVCLTLCTYVFVVITRPIPSVYSEQNTRGFLRGVVTKTQTFCVEMNENTPR